MKRFYYLILVLIGTVFMQSCEDDCTQDAYCQLISTQDYGKSSSSKTAGKTTLCHVTGSGNYQTIEVNNQAVQSHLDHGDTLGECGTLSTNELGFRDGEIVEIPCSYELPFLHTTENGTQWYYTSPSNR